MEHVSSPHNSLRPALLIAACLASLTAALTLTDIYRQQSERQAVAVAMTKGDPARAPAIFRRYGCAGCHTIPGIEGADGRVGPPLAQFAARQTIAGELPNTPDDLLRFLKSPRTVVRNGPGSEMGALSKSSA